MLVNKANLVHNFSKYVYFFSLHVSGEYVPIIRRNNCIYATLVLVTLKHSHIAFNFSDKRLRII
jgi:hypothetical protein